MAVSDIKISALVAAGVVGGITLLAVWNDALPGSCTLALTPSKFRWFAATTNNRALATQIGETPAPIFTHAPVTGTMYYWVAAVDAAGNQGDYYPTGATSGTVGTSKAATSGDIADGAVTGPKIGDGTVSPQKFITGTTPVEIVATLPTTGNYEGRVVYRTTDDKLYRYTGSAYTAAVDASDLAGQITVTQITDGAISTPKLAANAVTAANIAANAVTADKIIAGAISAAKIAASAITSDKLTAGVINASSYLLDGVVLTEKLALNAVTIGDVQTNNNTANFLLTPITYASIDVLNVPAGAAVTIISTLNINWRNTDSSAFGTVRLSIQKNGVIIGSARDIFVDDSWSGLQTWSAIDRTPSVGTNTYVLVGQAISSGATLQHYGGGGTLNYLLTKR